MASCFDTPILLWYALAVAATPAHVAHQPAIARNDKEAAGCSVSPSSPTSSSPSSSATGSVASLLDKGIATLGGKDALIDPKGISSYA